MADADPLQKLREFNKLLRETSALVKEKTTAFDEQDDALEEVEEERVSRLNDALEDFEKGVTEAHASALESLDGLRGAAEEIRDRTLSEAARGLERMETTLDQQLDADAAALERDWSELEGSGFDALEAAAKDAAEGYAALEQEAGQAFQALDTGMDALQQRLDSAADTAASGIDALAATLASEQGPALQSQAEASEALWSELPGALEQDCDAGSQALTSLYESAENHAVSSGEELVTSTDVLDDALGALDPHGTELAGQVDTLEDALGDLRLEGQALDSALRPGAEAAAELLPLLGELATAVGKAGEIRQALDRIEA